MSTTREGHEAPTTFHRGEGDLPFVPIGDGSHLQLLHVDLTNNLWVARQRFEPGTVLPRHLHTGPVHVVTVHGRWKYREYDDVNTPGSYLFEPAGSVHTFTVPDDNPGLTEIWFSITGANLNLDDDDRVVDIVDARSVSRFYFKRCKQLGLPRPAVIEL
jgi:2,4'-dihydroxyacetophenone dioxygenase